MVAVLSEHIRPDRDIIIHGDARRAENGCGSSPETWCLPRPYPAFPADWNRHHKAAGHIRNQQMLTEGKPTLVLAFHNNIMGSKGTRDMIKISMKAEVPVYLNGVRVFTI